MKKKPASPSKSSNEEEKLNEFLHGAETIIEENTTCYPWQEENVDDFSTKVFNLRLPESYALKLDYLAKQSMPKVSKQHFILERLLPLLDEELEKRNLPI